MRFSLVRRFALAALVPALLVVSVIPGCSNESEGERCGDDMGPNTDDCQSGLICIAVNQDGVSYDRCCNANRTIINDSRCQDTVTTTPDAGSSTPDAGDAGDTTEGGTSGLGDASSANGGTGATIGAAGADTAGAAGSN